MKRFTKRTNIYRLLLPHYRLRKRSKRKIRLWKRKRLFCDYFKITAPEVFDIREKEERRRLIAFINAIKDNIGTKKILLNFKNSKRMITCGTILFLAEIRTMYMKHDKPIMSCILSQNNKVNQVLKQIGFFDIIGFQEAIKPKYSDVVKWKFTHGSEVIGAKYEDILKQYDDDIGHKTSENLYIAFTEAMKNTQQHAYENKEKNTLKETWWAFSQLKDNKLVVVFCDLGMGISESLNKEHNPFAQKFKEVIGWSFTSESDTIAEIIKFRKTKTKLSYRGKGLAQLCGVIEESKNGAVFIFSNKGTYSNKMISIPNDYRQAIPGTIIEWSLNLDTEE